jgi:hypothetical protein
VIGLRWQWLRDWLSGLAEVVEATPWELQDRRLNAMATRIDELATELSALKRDNGSTSGTATGGEDVSASG